ncbi:MAG TPA: hypothetical protein VK921_11155 [Anditalea sp.]|nr:hypothetical protein [Anditalea sp.]
MKKVSFLLVIVCSSFLLSCNDEILPTLPASTIILNSNSEELNVRVAKEGTGVIGVINTNNNITAGRIESPGNLPLELVAQVNPPSYEGNTLQATHVDIHENFAYVTYATQGEKHLGAIDIFDISQINTPKISSQAIFTNADLTAVKYHEGKLYISSAFDIDSEASIKSPANLISVSTQNGQFTSDFIIEPLRGFAGMDVTYTEENIVTVTATHGAISLLTKNNPILVREKSYPDLRSVLATKESLVVLDGIQGIHFLNPNSLQPIRTIALEEGLPASKRTLDSYENMLIVSEGQKGAGLYDLSTGAALHRLRIPNRENNPEHVTNAVSVNNSHLYMANGGAGISIANVSGPSSIEEIGVLELQGSANFIKVNDKHIIVAAGTKGVKILRITMAEESFKNEICGNLPYYTGGNNININTNRPQGYYGSVVAETLNINDHFTFCGSLAVKGWANINSNGSFNMNGTLTVGQYGKDSGMNINDIFSIDGHLIIYGDLTLNSNAKLEFLGENSSITVYGKVNRNSGHIIRGKYVDTEGKL